MFLGGVRGTAGVRGQHEVRQKHTDLVGGNASFTATAKQPDVQNDAVKAEGSVPDSPSPTGKTGVTGEKLVNTLKPLMLLITFSFQLEPFCENVSGTTINLAHRYIR